MTSELDNVKNQRQNLLVDDEHSQPHDQDGDSDQNRSENRERSFTSGTTSNAVALQARDLVKVYDGGETVRAVEGVSFDVNEGEFVSIIGPSGSGKSTILRMIAGFEEPTEGSVVLDGIEITDRPPFDRDTNMMFQDLALFPNYTVSENIGYGPRQDGVPKKERASMVEEMLSMVHLEGYGDRAIDELSGGEQQRVALARCMINNPKVVLFDEPLASLDRQLRRDMTAELRDIQDQTGSTFLYVTHNQQVALSASDRVIVLNDGRVEQVGTPDELYNDPQTEFVANFVGDMNMFTSATTLAGDGNQSVAIGADPIPLPPDMVETRRSEMLIGVRPYDFNLAHDHGEVSKCYLEGVVSGTMFNGDRTVVSVTTDLGEFLSETTATTEQGATVFLHCSPDDMHFYQVDGVDDE